MSLGGVGDREPRRELDAGLAGGEDHDRDVVHGVTRQEDELAIEAARRGERRSSGTADCVTVSGLVRSELRIAASEPR